MKHFLPLALCALIFREVVGQSTTVAPKTMMIDTKTVVNQAVKGQIVLGLPALPGQVPWQASIYITKPSSTFFCGGSLIHQGWILTAGTCTIDGTSFTIRLGSVFPNSGTLIISKTAFTHVDFNPSTKNHDIGLIQLPSPVSLTSYIKVIKILPKAQSCSTALRVLSISGWGMWTDLGPTISPFLVWSTVNEITNMQCFPTYGPAVVSPTTLCAKGFLIQSICSGDNGGAIVLSASGSNPIYQVGIASFWPNQGCGIGLPSGYTRVTPYLEWIQYITNQTL